MHQLMRRVVFAMHVSTAACDYTVFETGFVIL